MIRLIKIKKSLRRFVTLSLYRLIGLRVEFWRREIDRVWQLGNREYCKYIDSVLKSIQPRDSSGSIVSTLISLEKASVLTKEELRQTSKKGAPKNNAFSRFTSGTSGTRVSVLLKKDELSRMLAVRDYCLNYYGVKLGEREARIWGVSVPTFTGRMKDWLLHRRSFCVTEKSHSEVIKGLKKWRPDYIYGYSSCILSLANYLIDTKSEVPKVSLIICTAEQVLPAQKNTISQAFGASVAEEYGLTEFDIVGFEDSNGDIRLANPWLIVESVKEEINISDIYRESQWFVRYRTGDVGRVEKKLSPGFGSSTIIKDLQGRVGDRFVYGNNGDTFHASEISRSMNLYFLKTGEILDFTAVQEKRGQFQLHVSMEPSIGLSELCRELSLDLRKRTTVIIDIFPGTVGQLGKLKNKRSYFIQSIQKP